MATLIEPNKQRTQPQVPIEEIQKGVIEVFALPNGVWQLTSYRMFFIKIRLLLKKLGFDEGVFCRVSQQVCQKGDSCMSFYVNRERKLDFAKLDARYDLTMEQSLVAILQATMETELKPYDPTEHFWA